MTIDDFYIQYSDYCCVLNPTQNKTLDEKKAELKLKAVNKSHIIKVDKGIFPKNQENKRADYMAYTDKNLYIIELKGRGGVENAYVQISSTIDAIVHSNNFNFLIHNRDKTMACIAGQVRIPKGGSRKEMELAKKLAKHSEKQKNITDLIIYSYKNKHNLFLE